MSNLEHWDARYVEGDTPWDTGHPSAELVKVLREEKIGPCPAIDIGCGTGTNAVYLAKQGFEVTAIDLSPTAVDRGRSKKATAAVKVRFLAGNIMDPPDDIGGPYGFFFDRGCYHIVRKIDLDGYMKTVERITQPGSLGLVLTGNPKEPREKGPPTVTEEELRSEWGRLFEFVWLREFRFDPVSGPDDKPLGWSCLVRRKM
jgi:methyl halide transferase